jgi:hypothetical protein
VALIEAANSAAGRTKDTYLRAQYLRIKAGAISRASCAAAGAYAR